ncbi:MAG: Gfo/Idh/MocA family oxidoreductase [Bacillota bacterium]|nr:Gfo/Idh/MocA family oxidoreductase [Bacillota bacterium]
MINVCIVGYGSIGPVHAKACSITEGVKVYGICDIDILKADKRAKEYNAKAFYNIDEALSDNNIDSFHICTPHYLHYEMVSKVLNHGKKVVCEKPVVMVKEDFEKTLNDWKDKPVSVMFQNRNNPSIQCLKKIIETDESIGKLIGVKGIVTWCRTESYYASASWRGKKDKEGGAVLINQAIHTLDLITFLCGKVTKVKANTANHSLEGIIEVEDTVEAYMTFENGFHGLFYASVANSFDSPPLIELKFENALFRYMDGCLYKNGELLEKDIAPSIGKPCWGSGHALEIHNIYNENKQISIEDVANTMYAVFGIYESAAKGGKEITLWK